MGNSLKVNRYFHRAAVSVIPVLLTSCIAVLTVSCGNRYTLEAYRPILGEWETERGIIVSLRMEPEGSAAAIITVIKGILNDEIHPGTVLISDIRPLVDGGWRGSMNVPGARPLAVKMLVTAPGTLLIGTWDSRAKTKVMRWTRSNR